MSVVRMLVLGGGVATIAAGLAVAGTPSASAAPRPVAVAGDDQRSPAWVRSPLFRSLVGPLANILYYDDLSDENSGWIVYWLDHSHGYYDNSTYRIDMTTTSPLVSYGTLLRHSFSDFDARAVLRSHFPDPDELIWLMFQFRYQHTRDIYGYYSFEIAPNGSWWRLNKWDTNKYVIMVDKTITDALNPLWMDNTLRVVANGPSLTLYANNTLLTQVNDTRWTEGTFGLGIGTAHRDQATHSGALDSLVVYDLDIGTPLPSPTPRPIQTVGTNTPEPGRGPRTATPTPSHTPTWTPYPTWTALPTRTPRNTPSSTPTATASLTPAPPTRTPLPQPDVVICPGLDRKVPSAVIADKAARPENVNGWGLRCNPAQPPSPFNGLRTSLTLQNGGLPFNPVSNNLVYKCGCN